VLKALKYLGTNKTYSLLYKYLGFGDKNNENYNFLYPYYNEALSLLWHLSQNKKQKDEILSRINPRELPYSIEADLGAVIPENELNLLMLRKDEFVASEMIITLCKYNAENSIPLISELLLKHIQELAIDYSKEDNIYTELIVSYDIKRAIIDLGKNLYERKKIRPVVLTYAINEFEAGDFFLSEMVISIIENNELSSEELRILLEILESLNYVKDIGRIKNLLRHKSPDVRKMVIPCFAKYDLKGFIPVFRKLINSDDIQTTRQAILAVKKFDKLNTASSIIADALENRNMNIKKTAAIALRNIKDEYVTKRLMFWLGHHNNPGFRNEILLSLKSIYASFLSSVIINEIEHSQDKRRKDLLLLALDYELKTSAFKNMLKIKSHTSELIIEALFKGDIYLNDGHLSGLKKEIDFYCKSFSFESEFYSFNNKNILERKNNKKSEEDILLKGWSVELAENLIKSEKKSSKNINIVLEYYLKEWLDFIEEAKGEKYKKACVYFIDFTLSDNKNNLHNQILLQNYSKIVSMIENNENVEIKYKLIDLLISISPFISGFLKIELGNRARKWDKLTLGDGQSRYNLLKACNIELNTNDILIFLRDCLYTSNPKEFMKKVLRTAFKVRDNIVLSDKEIQNLKNNNDIKNTEKTLTYLIDLSVFTFQENTKEEKEILKIIEKIEKIQPLNTSLLPDREFVTNKEKKEKKEKIKNIVPSFKERNRLFDLLLDEENKLDKNQQNEIIDTLLNWPEISDDFEIILDMFLNDEIESLNISPLADFIEERSSKEFIKKIENMNIKSQINFLKILVFTSKENIKEYLPYFSKLWKSENKDLLLIIKDCMKKLNADSLLPFVYEQVKRGEFAIIDFLSPTLTENNEIYEIIDILKKEKDDNYLNKFSDLIRKRPIYLSNDKRKEFTEFQNFKKRTVANKNKNKKVIDSQSDISKLIKIATGRDLDETRTAIKAMINHNGDKELIVSTLIKLTSHRNLKIRSYAHKALKKKADRNTYLEITVSFLYDPREEVKCSAIKTLSFAKYKPALSYIIGFLADKSPIIQEAAREGVILYGELALNILSKRKKSARPDKKVYFSDVIDVIVGDIL